MPDRQAHRQGLKQYPDPHPLVKPRRPCRVHGTLRGHLDDALVRAANLAPYAVAHHLRLAVGHAVALTLTLAGLALALALALAAVLALALALAAVLALALAAVLALACNTDRDELAIAIGVRRALLQSREAQGCAAMPAAC